MDDNSYLKKTRCVFGVKKQSGLLSWLLTLDHKRIGVMYLITTLSMFMVGALLALVLRTELLNGDSAMLSADGFNRLFTLHGLMMIFLFLLPGIPATLGNFVLPLQLGARNLAFPRLNLLSFWLYCAGGLLMICSIPAGGPNAGWALTVPYSLEAGGMGVVFVLLGLILIGCSSILTGMNFIVSIQKLRSPGLTWFRLPLFVWALYATAIAQVLAIPVLNCTLALLILEQTLQIGIFHPDLGGDPVMFQQFLWFGLHPVVYCAVIPGFGIASELISVFSRKHVSGYRALAFSSMLVAVLSFLAWGHHLFTSGQSPAVSTIFSALTLVVAIPLTVMIYNWIATLHRGSITFETPMLYGLMFIVSLSIGALSGLPLALGATGSYLQGTYFSVAHLHHLLFGGMVIAMLGGLHYWWPKITGRMYNEFLGQASCFFVFVGFNVTFLSQFLLGIQGGVPRSWHYPPELLVYHQISTAGSYVLGIGLIAIAFNLLRSLSSGRRAPANPWGAATLEWQGASPPRHDNFETAPAVGDPYDFSGLVYDPDRGGWRPV